MAKISIAGVKKGLQNFTIHVLLTEMQGEGDQAVDAAIGEAFVSVPHTMSMEDIKKAVVKSSKDIYKAHQDAIDKRKDLEEAAWPPIP